MSEWKATERQKAVWARFDELMAQGKTEDEAAEIIESEFGTDENPKPLPKAAESSQDQRNTTNEGANIMARNQPTNAKIIDTRHGQHYIALYYRSPNLEPCHTDYVYVDTREIRVGLCNQRYLTWNGAELPID